MDNLQTVDTQIADFSTEKATRRPFAYWEVGSEKYKLKLKARDVSNIEERYNESIIDMISVDGIPKLDNMISIVHGAMSAWTHGLTRNDVFDLYDKWVEECGGSQMAFYMTVVMPTLSVSGFFTKKMEDELEADMKEIMENL